MTYKYNHNIQKQLAVSVCLAERCCTAGSAVNYTNYNCKILQNNLVFVNA